MGYINLFKINSDDKLFQEFRVLLNGLPQIGKPKTLPSPNLKKDYKLSFYAMPSQNDSSSSKELSWRWVYDEFKSVAPRPSPYPRDVLVIQDLSNQNCYCVTFGNSFFKIDRYCDRDFGFNFARKIDIKETRTCTKSSPGLKRNKTVNTYVKFEGLDHDSSEAYSKLKILVPKQPDFNLFQPTVSIGQSIRFNVGSKNDSLNTVLQLIEYVEKTLTLEDKNKIPIFRLIKDKDLIDKLDSFLIQKIITDDVAILNPELEIYGSTEVLNNADQRFLIKSGKHQKKVDELSTQIIRTFCNEMGIPFDQNVLNFNITLYQNGSSVVTKKLKELIEITCDAEYAVISKGKWYHYNQVFIEFLDDSISAMDTEYIERCNLTESVRTEFINKRFSEEKDSEKFKGKTEEQIRKSINNKYYPERIFNLLRQGDGYELLDRNIVQIGGHNLEIADLYHDKTLFAVKIGNNSSSLCYAIDQSLASLHNKEKWERDVDTLALWFVLERKEHIEDETGKPDLSKLKMLYLKMRIDEWYREVIKHHLKPKIFISYKD